MFMNTPKIVKYLLFLNISIFILLNFMLFSTGFANFQSIYMEFGLVPSEFWDGALWQPITSMFLHGGLFHLLMNMIALWSIGSLLEHQLGSRNFFSLYFISGLVGALFVIIFQADAQIPTVGASGAIIGLLGTLAIRYPNTSLLLFFIPIKARTAAISLGLISVLLAIFDQSSQISHLGHLGGLIGGLLFAKFMLNIPARQPENNNISSLFNRSDIRESNNSHMNERKPGRVIVYDPYTGKFRYM